ncbi:MAG: hypothetical protein QXF26_00850 [Candidatus Bathyarchaeia archaeon]
MGEEEKKEEEGVSKHEHSEDVEELKEVLSVVSKEIPELIKGLVTSVFSEEAGRNMGKAAAAFYKELKEVGMPEETAIKMTENYISTFTNFGDVMKRVAGGWGHPKEEVVEKELKKEKADEDDDK